MGESGRRRADVALEVPGEMRLVVEADAHGHLRDRLPLEQRRRAARCGDRAGSDAAGYRTPGRSTAPDGSDDTWRMRSASPTSAARTDARRAGRADRTRRRPAVGRRGRRGRSPRWSRSRAPTTASMASAPNGSSGSSSTPWSAWSPPNERRILDVGVVDGPADQPFIQDVGADVQHTLAEPLACRPPARRARRAAAVSSPASRPHRDASASRSYRIAPWSTMNTVHVSWVCGGYAWSTNRAWKTSWMPGTAGFHARTHSRSVAKTGRSYKTRLASRVLDGGVWRR